MIIGSKIHSHDYKEPEVYENRRVLLIGAGPSGLDLALHLSNVTAKLIHSHHLVYNQPDFGENFVKKPDVKNFVPNGVIFVDGTFEEIDDVILATGIYCVYITTNLDKYIHNVEILQYESKINC